MDPSIDPSTVDAVQLAQEENEIGNNQLNNLEA